MKKAHLAYLKKAVNLAVNLNGIADVASQIGMLKSYKPPVYGLIRDLVSDPRFYSVTANTPFWHRYARASVQEFIETISEPVWHDLYLLNKAKEEFLYSWYCLNIIPMSPAREKEIESELIRKGLCQSSDRDLEEDIDELPYHGSNLGRIQNYTDSPDGINEEDMNDMPQEIRQYAHNAARGAGGGESETHKAEAAYLTQIDRSLVDLAKMIGRHGTVAQTSGIGRFQHSHRSDINGVTVGDDLNALLPVELVMLGTRATQDVFFRRFTQKRLQVFSSNSNVETHARQDKGPIIMCIDTSGSMYGDPERMAKSLALAVAIIAQRTRRPLCIVNYSFNISFFILLNMKRQRRGLLRFLSLSYSGGNNENLLFDFVFRQLPEDRRFRTLRHRFQGADLLVISDFEWMPLSEDTLRLIEEARAKEMKMYALGVDLFDSFGVHDESGFDDEPMVDGFRFFDSCDHRFLYTDGVVREIKENKLLKDKRDATENEAGRRHGLRSRKSWPRNDN